MELEKHHLAGQALVRRCGDVLRTPALAKKFASNLKKICDIHIITFAYKSGRLELARNNAGVSAFIRASARYFRESVATNETYLQQCKVNNDCTKLSFLGIILYGYSIIVSHFAQYHYRSIIKHSK
jgi:glutaminase